MDIFLLGDGSEPLSPALARLEEVIKERGLNNVIMLGQLPKTDMPRLWSVSNASLVLLRKLDLFLTVIPSKIFESMAMKKPIILGVDGESRGIIEEAGAGIPIEPENAQQLAEAIQRLADDPTLCQQIGDKGLAHVQEHFDRSVLAGRYEGVLVGMVGG